MATLFKFSVVDFLFTCVGLLCLLADVGLDVLAAVSFYQEKAYVSLGLLLLFLVGSSLLVQAFSWLWYSYEDFEPHSEVEKRLDQTQLRLLHVFQLGIYVRHAGVIEMSCRSLCTRSDHHKDNAVFLGHDLSLLRLFETFMEGAPQFVLMLTLILQQGQLDPVTVLKAIGSASAIASSVTMYHRSLRSFLRDKEQLNIASSLVYFLWNLFLISSRLTALALYASVQPCFIFAHFFCSWLVLFFFAWRAKTDLMNSPCGEWLYRATVGLIWYFDWFNVVAGRTRSRTLFYHGYILADIALLCSLWYWKMTTESHHFKIPDLYAVITATSVVGFYIVGIIFKLIYYKFSHPNMKKEELKGRLSESSPIELRTTTDNRVDEVDSSSSSHEDEHLKVTDRRLPSPASPAAAYVFTSDTTTPGAKLCNKRMRMLAQNFYS